MFAKTRCYRNVGLWCGLIVAPIFLAATSARSQDLNGIWQWSDGTTIAIVQRGTTIEGRVQQPSARASGTYGRRPGDLVLQGTINGTRITGTRHYRFPLSTAARCPNVRGGSGAVEMQVIDGGTLKSRRRNGVLLDGCQIGDGGWVDEPYTRQTPVAATPVPKPAPQPVPKPAPPAPAAERPFDFDRMTTDDLFKICAECLEQGVDFLALKQTYPIVKQRWLDLTAQYAALGGETARGRMQVELKQLETALTPPPPTDYSFIDGYLSQLSAGWNRHLAGVDAGIGVQTRRLNQLVSLIFGGNEAYFDGEELEYDRERGKALTPTERKLLNEADYAEVRRRNKQVRRKNDLIQQLAAMDELVRQIADADAAVNRVEKQVLQAIDTLKACMQRCKR